MSTNSNISELQARIDALQAELKVAVAAEPKVFLITVNSTIFEKFPTTKVPAWAAEVKAVLEAGMSGQPITGYVRVGRRELNDREEAFFAEYRNVAKGHAQHNTFANKVWDDVVKYGGISERQAKALDKHIQRWIDDGLLTL